MWHLHFSEGRAMVFEERGSRVPILLSKRSLWATQLHPARTVIPNKQPACFFKYTMKKKSEKFQITSVLCL
jgi:hypothetical protein